MKFRTKIELNKRDFPTISHYDGLFFIGSCFSSTIGSWFKDLKFNTLLNPFGTTYNPVSIAWQLERILSEKPFSESEVFEKDGIWNSFQLHGSFNSPDRKVLLDRINDTISKASGKLKSSKYVFITLGTAWVYKLTKEKTIVNNCHKFPSDLFSRELLSVEEVESALKAAMDTVKKVNPQVQFMLTLSPVRHLRDGFAENSLSKAVLRLAIQNLCTTSGARYLPVSEMLLDDLRDYRFYDEDLVHPNSSAIQYIREVLSEVLFDDSTKQTILKVEKLNRAMQHRIFNPASVETKKFVDATEKLALELEGIGIDVENELRKLRNYPNDSATNF